MASKILVTGATGGISSAIVNRLQTADCQVRALVRNPDKAASLKAQGAEIVVGDLERPKTLEQAFVGVDVAFILTSPSPRAPEQSSNAIWAARQAGVKHVVRLSAFGAAHDAPTINGRLHALSDSELIASGIPYTILKPHFFMQNLMMAVGEAIKGGVLHFPLAEGKMGLIDTADISEFAAKVLTSKGHDNKTYTLTGPASISMHEVASALSDAVGRPIQYQAVPVEQALVQLSQLGVDDFSLNLLRDYFNAYSNNWGDIVSNDFPNVMGKSACSIADFMQRLAASQ